MQDALFELLNSDSKSTGFRIEHFDNADRFININKYNLFSVMLILEGQGMLTADMTDYQFQTHSLVSLSLYQPFKIKSSGVFRAVMINFHPEFFCLHKHRHEVSCNGVLFNNVYESPVLDLVETEARLLANAFEGVSAEMQRADQVEPEVLLSYLKILLIDASRMKIDKRSTEQVSLTPKVPEILHELKNAIEQRFRSLHSPADYAGLLNITPAALNRLSKTHFNKTLSTLIAERLVTEGKRELYLTDKPVKLVAYELGFSDEFYFSRYFKNIVGVSPQFFRDTVGFNKAVAQ